jgi:hypothetical protein
MTILEISPLALALLFLASLAHGAVVAMLYCATGVMLNFRRLWRLDKAPRPSECASLARYSRGEATTAYKLLVGACDLLIVLIAACLLLVVNFIFNNGVFRLFTIPASALGFAAANAALGGAARIILTYLILCVRKLLRLVLAPLRRLAAAIYNIIRRIITRARRFARAVRIKRYTKIQFGRLSAVQRDGMPP